MHPYLCRDSTAPSRTAALHRETCSRPLPCQSADRPSHTELSRIVRERKGQTEKAEMPEHRKKNARALVRSLDSRIFSASNSTLPDSGPSSAASVFEQKKKTGRAFRRSPHFHF